MHCAGNDIDQGHPSLVNTRMMLLEFYNQTIRLNTKGRGTLF